MKTFTLWQEKLYCYWAVLTVQGGVMVNVWEGEAKIQNVAEMKSFISATLYPVVARCAQENPHLSPRHYQGDDEFIVEMRDKQGKAEVVFRMTLTPI